MSDTITLTAEDGHAFDAWTTPAEGTRRGGLVILQEIFGLTDQLKDVGRAYAAQGWAVAMPALFDRVERGAVVPFDDAGRGRDLMQAIPRDATMRDIAATVRHLTSEGPVAMLGFCWGGGLAVRAAQEMDVAAAVAFYGTRLDTILDGTRLKAPLQFHAGRTDDHTPADLVDRLAEFGEAEVHWYDAGHAFANDRRASFVPEAAAQAHDRAAAFLSDRVRA